MTGDRKDDDGRSPLGDLEDIQIGEPLEGPPKVDEDDPLAFLRKVDESPAADEPLGLEPVPEAPVRSPGTAAPSVPAIILDTPETGAGAAPASTGISGRMRAEYTNDPPSMIPDRPRDPSSGPPGPPGPPRSVAPRPRPAPQPLWKTIPSWARIATAGTVVLVVALVVYRALAAPPPVVSAVAPPKIEPGANLTVTGEGLSGASAIRVGTAEGEVTSRSDTEVVAAVPADAPVGVNVPVAVRSGGQVSNALLVHVVQFPRLRSVTPDVARPGHEVVLEGTALRGKATEVRIGPLSAEILGGDGNSLKVRIPALDVPEGRAVDVVVHVDGERARPMPLLIGRLPLISGLVPAAGPPGARVTVNGRGFAMEPGANAVTFGGQPAVVLSASATALVVAAPAATGLVSSGAPVPVSVMAGGARSSEAAFTLRRESSEGYRPRFFPAPLPGAPADHLAVATEIGPVLVVGGKGDAPSTAERAMQVAEALTRMVDSGAPVAFQAQDGVVTAGGSRLLTATAADADAYLRASGGRGGRVAPRQLAAFWAALLEDYVGLFAARARPVRTADLTDRARVLLELFAETERQGRSLVPVRLVAEMSPARQSALRDLALLPPGGGAASGVAVAGRWSGQMEDGGVSRAFQVEITEDGGRLGGTLATRSGRLDMRVPLRGVGYSGGTVTFTATVGGTEQTFRGRLEGVSITGTFHPGTGSDAGRFTLRLVG